ncbi:5685_t:CDS:2, partial [Racocetra fulgida]
GDSDQVPTVLNLPMYATNVSRDPLSNSGIISYDSREQQIFKEFLLRLHNSKSTFEDWKTLTIRIEKKYNRTECDRFLNAMFILSKWSKVDAVNLNKLKSLKNPVVKVLAKHTGDQEAKKADSDIAKGLEAQLLLAKDA